MQKQLDELWQKEITRKEFLATLGFGLASIFGFANIIRLLSGKSFEDRLRHQANGYGSSPYGGGRDGL